MKKLLFLIFLTSYGFAQTDGTLDSSFGVNGKVFTHILPFSEGHYVGDAIELSDNSILVGGSCWGVSSLLVKYLPSGDFDNSFGSNGSSGYVDLYSHGIMKMALQPDGNIVIGGILRSQGNPSYVFVGRALQSGVIDTTFQGGWITQLSPNASWLGGLHVLPDNKIIALANVSNNNPDIQIMKLNQDGTRDTTFGNNGVVINNFGNFNQGASASVMNGDKILIAGGAWTQVNGSLLMQLNADGSLDTNFGTNNGYTQVLFGGGNGWLSSDVFSTIQIHNNKIYAAGGLNPDGENVYITLAKFNMDGRLDTTFGDNGKLVIDRPNKGDFISQLHILNDGSILLGGQASYGENLGDFLIIKLNPDGTFANDFGINGVVTTSMGTYMSQIKKLIVNQNSIIAVGTCSTSLWNQSTDIALAKYHNENPLGLIQNPTDANAFSLYPNPVNDQLQLQNLSKKKIDRITIIDMLGNIV